jgi:hypothetical protein
MADEVTRDTLIKDLKAPVRVINALLNAYPLPEGLNRSLTVGDVLDVSDLELIRVPNFGRFSLSEWKRLTAHLREGYTEAGGELSEEYIALRRVRSILNTVGGAHKNLARLYEELAEIVLPFERT